MAEGLTALSDAFLEGFTAFSIFFYAVATEILVPNHPLTSQTHRLMKVGSNQPLEYAPIYISSDYIVTDKR